MNVTEGTTVNICLSKGGIKAYFSRIHEEPSITNHEFSIEMKVNETSLSTSRINATCRKHFLNFTSNLTADDLDRLDHIYASIEGTSEKNVFSLSYFAGNLDKPEPRI